MFGAFCLDGFVPAIDVVWAKRPNASRGSRVGILRHTALEWRLANEPAVKVLTPDKALPYSRFYEGLVPGALPLRCENLQHSDSYVCFASRTTGDAASYRLLSAMDLGDAAGSAHVADLLSVHSWGSSSISRTAFYNSRTGRLDRPGSQVVVADGQDAFLKAIDTFEHASVIGAVHRIADRDRLEMIANKLLTLRSRYSVDTCTHSQLPVTPAGVTACVLVRP
jgi:hypothetical protein